MCVFVRITGLSVQRKPLISRNAEFMFAKCQSGIEELSLTNKPTQTASLKKNSFSFSLFYLYRIFNKTVLTMWVWNSITRLKDKMTYLFLLFLKIRSSRVIRRRRSLAIREDYLIAVLDVNAFRWSRNGKIFFSGKRNCPTTIVLVDICGIEMLLPR